MVKSPSGALWRGFYDRYGRVFIPKFGKIVQIWKVYEQDRARDVMPPPPGRDEILFKGLVHHHHTHNSHYAAGAVGLRGVVGSNSLRTRFWKVHFPN